MKKTHFLFLLFVLLILCKVWGFGFETIISGNPPMIGTYEAKFIELEIKDSILKKIYDELIVELKYDEAIKILLEQKERYEKSKSAGEYNMLLGYCYFNNGNFNEAEVILIESINHNPENYISLYLLGNLYFVKGDNKKAIEYLERSIKVKPTFIIARRVLAQLYIDLKEYSQGIRHYQEIVNFVPRSGYYLYQLYLAYYRAGKYKEALEILNKLIELQPQVFINYSRLTDIYIKLGDYKKAEEVCQKLLEYPDNSIKSEGYYHLANIYYNQNKLSKAKEYINKSYEIKPDPSKELLKYKIDTSIKEQTKNLIFRLILLLSFFLLLTVTLSFFYYYNTQKELEKISRKVERVIEEIDNLQYFCSVFIGFIAEILKDYFEFGIFLLNNLSTSQLYSIAYQGNVSEELINLQIVVNADPRELINKKLLSTDLTNIKSFSPRLVHLVEETFPSLLGRLLKNNANYIIPLIDKKNLKGIIVLKMKKEIGFFKMFDINQKIGNIVFKFIPYIDSFLFHETATIDDTTGIYNRKFFENALQNELKRAERYSLTLSLIVCDLDNFKKINDNFGHLTGDKVLKETAQIIKNNIREGIDVAARWGGEEFVILLPSTDKNSAYKIAERIRAQISSHKYSGLPENYPVTASIGVANYPIDAKGKTELFKKADDAVYEAKKKGKNRVVLAKESEKEENIKPYVDTSREPRIDSISNLYIYTEFMIDFEKEIKRARRYTLPVSLILVKPLILFQTNDQEVIQNIASKIGKDIRENIRFGVDIATFDKEKRIFLLLLPHTEKSRAYLVSQRLLTKLSEYGTVLQSITSFPEDGISTNIIINKSLKLLEIATPEEPIQSLLKF
ncbi:MAG: diguanylate cyclase [Candidatus Calescibacterium sp.]|nr:diguanylate cyclase [Candidatus Calescibacterium sp.]MCX7972352.1 diguanylate cyclase [bacterium]MDW8195927.1 diguanylate cyclase [Candidatus Calescibacterium sp.]